MGIEKRALVKLDGSPADWLANTQQVNIKGTFTVQQACYSVDKYPDKQLIIGRKENIMNEEMKKDEYVDEDFHISNDKAAEWLIRKTLQIRDEKERVKAQYHNIIDHLNMDEDALISRYGVELAEYVSTKLAGGKKRTWKTLFGNVAFRKVPASMRLINEAEAMEYASQHYPELIILKPSLDRTGYVSKAEVVSHIDQSTGEWIEEGVDLPGVDYTPEHDSMNITKVRQTNTEENSNE